MTHFTDIPLCEPLDTAWDDADNLRDLIATTPLVYNADGMPVGYDAQQLFGLEADYLGGRA